MRKILLFALTAVGICSIGSCDRFKGPEEILEKANKALYEEDDVETYFSYIYLPGECTTTDMEDIKATVKHKVDSTKTANDGIKGIRLEELGKLDEIANYNMIVKYGNGKCDTTFISLYKKEGLWKINDFAITGMAQQKGFK